MTLGFDTISIGSAPPITLQLKQSVSTIGLGQSVGYSVSFTGSKPKMAAPSGRIGLVDTLGNWVGTPTVLVNGAAAFTVPWYHAGQQAVFAYYEGDANYPAMTSPIAMTLVHPAPTTTLLSATASANSTTALTALVNTQVTGPNVQTPGYESGLVEYFDSVNGAPAVPLSGGTQILTIGNGGTSINTLQVSLPQGTNVIMARFLGNADWLPSQSNPVVVSVH